MPEDTASVGSYARHADWVTRKSELRRLNLGQNEPWKLGICYPNHDGVLRSAWRRRQRPRYTFKIADNLLALFTDGGYYERTPTLGRSVPQSVRCCPKWQLQLTDGSLHPGLRVHLARPCPAGQLLSSYLPSSAPQLPPPQLVSCPPKHEAAELSYV